MIKAVIFDMDGVLVDTEPYWMEAEKTIFGNLGLEITPEMHKQTYGLGVKESVKFWYNFKPWTGKNLSSVVDEMYNYVGGKMKEKVSPLPGVEYIFNFFIEKGIPMAIASASPKFMIDIVTDELNINDKLLVKHSCEFEDFEKPHPAVYISTAKKLGVEPSQCLVFEDSFVGLISAIAARAKTISIPHGYHASDSRYDIANLRLNSLNDFNDRNFEILNN